MEGTGGVRPFSGRDGDLQEFWVKFQVIGKIKMWADGKARMEHMPLYLTGDAFSVWSQMDTGDQEDEDKVKAALESAFSMRPGEAYGQFVRRRKRGDESVDAYLSDLRRLMRRSGHKEATDGKDPLLLEQFLVGLPPRYADQLRLSIAAASGQMTVAAVAEQARALCACLDSGKESLASAAAASQSVVCFECREVGHLRRDCPKLRRQNTAKSPRKIQCYKCKEFGHIKRNCPQATEHKSAGATSSTACAKSDAADKGGHAHACLSVTTRARGGMALPRIFVSVTGCAGRWTAAVDSCSSRSLLAKETAEMLGVAVRPVADEAGPLTAIDGTTVQVLGTANLTISKDDVNVHVPEVSAEFQVVKSLEVVAADLLIGIDIVSSLGGVHLVYDEASGGLTKVTFGPKLQNPAAVGALAEPESTTQKMPGHVSVAQEDGRVTLTMSDGEAVFDKANRFWTVCWKWADGEAPTHPIGAGIGEYSRQRLSEDQEAKFQEEVTMWVEKGWLVPCHVDKHGPIGAVLSLLAVCQEHKATTPVRPCLDYRALNDRIVSNPGKDAPVCGETIRKWRQRQTRSKVIDIRKAYLNVRVHPELQRFQAVVWEGQQYVMERMAFGLAVAPKLMDTIVKWVIHSIPDTDNYIDDIVTPEDKADVVTTQLHLHGLPTKPPVDFHARNVLGLKLSEADGQLQWQRQAPQCVDKAQCVRMVWEAYEPLPQMWLVASSG